MARVPGLIPVLIPGWGPSNIPGISHGALPEQSRKGCVVVMKRVT